MTDWKFREWYPIPWTSRRVDPETVDHHWDYRYAAKAPECKVVDEDLVTISRPGGMVRVHKDKAEAYAKKLAKAAKSPKLTLPRFHPVEYSNDFEGRVSFARNAERWTGGQWSYAEAFAKAERLSGVGQGNQPNEVIGICPICYLNVMSEDEITWTLAQFLNLDALTLKEHEESGAYGFHLHSRCYDSHKSAAA